MQHKLKIFLENHKLHLFFLIILLSLSPIIVLPIYSHYYHTIKNIPKIDHGVLDFGDYNLSESEEIPLDGEWEFYYGKALISGNDKYVGEEKSTLVHVPASGRKYSGIEKEWAEDKISSYRLVIKECPQDVELVVRIPNIMSPYRAYINGNLCAVKSWGDSGIKGVALPYERIKYAVNVEKGSRIVIVIELNSKNIKGLYTVPYLSGVSKFLRNTEMNKFIANCYLGIFLVIISYFFYIVIKFHYNKAFRALAIMDAIVLVRIIEKDEFYEITGRIFPILKNYWVVSCIQIITLFLPIAILYCGKQMGFFTIKKKVTQMILLYECVIACFVGVSAFHGWPVIQYGFVLASYIPFFYVIYHLYIQNKKQEYYTLLDVAALLFAIACMTGANMNMSGILLMNVSLFPPTCLLISLILQMMQYARQNQKNYVQALESENLKLQLKQKEVDLMMSQIKPHFLYNTLVTIQVLCTEEPETAAEAVSRFSRYLRGNIRFGKEERLISFEQELLHIENYTYIEKLRFADRLEVQFDIKERDFMLPPLCIQPLVENAIKHGACKRLDDEGMVKIESYREGDFIYVVVTDNGPGFAPEKASSKKDSYGISNIRFRLWEVLQGQITYGREGGYTRAIVRIPGEKLNEDDTN